MTEEMEPTITDFAGMWAKTIKQSFRTETSNLSRDYPHKKSLVIDVRKVFDRQLFDQLLQAPRKAIGHIRDALRWNAVLRLPSEADYDEIEIRFVHLPRKTPIREIRAEDIGEQVAIEGIVRRVSEVKPKLKMAVYRCRNCNALIRVPQPITGIKRETPNHCTGCDKTSARTFKFLDNGHEFVNCQVVTLQEPHELMGAGESPQSIEVMLFGDVTGKLNAGNRVTMNGILLTMPQARDAPMFDIFLEGLSFESDQQDPNALVVTDRELEQIQALANDPDIYGKLANSIAPTIYGNDPVKLAIVLQLFGGVRKQFEYTALRGDIHILMIGDPSVAKSQLMTAAVRLSGRGVLTSGKSATAAGLTAAATKDDSRLGGGKWVLEAGALVLADGGLAAVDELDKMNENDRSAILHALEQQTVPISKAGINTVLRTQCSLLAAANPKAGRFDIVQPLATQFNLEPALLSRFDLIFVLLDTATPGLDTQIAGHILNTHYTGGRIRARITTVGGNPSHLEPAVSQDLMKKYVAYARRTCNPVLTPEANEVIESYYLKLRGRNRDDSTVPATARQLEALIRLAEASAKVRLSPEVTVEDAERVTALVDASLRQVAYDPVSGKYDIDKMCGRTTKSQRDRIGIMTAIIRQFADEGTKVAKRSAVVGEAMARGLSDFEIQDALDTMSRNGLTIEPRGDTVKLL